MFRNYFKIAFRNLSKQKLYTGINVLGLAIGIAICMLAYLYLRHEFSYDRWYPDSENIYRLNGSFVIDNTTDAIALTPYPLAGAIASEIPEVVASTKIQEAWKETLLEYNGQKRYSMEYALVDSSFFHVFAMPFYRGDVKTALQRPDQVVVSRQFAEEFFGTSDAIGIVLKLNNNRDYTVSGVLAVPPGPSHFQFDLYVPARPRANLNSYWEGMFNYYTYAKLHPKSDVAAFQQKVDQLVKKNLLANIMEEGASDSNAPEVQAQINSIQIETMPITAIHLDSDLSYELNPPGDRTYIYTFLLIALIMLLIACINFMNLSTARASRRLKELGIKKASGATRGNLIIQHLSESLLMAFFSLLVAVLIVAILLPQFNAITYKQIALSFDLDLVIPAIVIAAATGLISGSYPAFYLSGFNPAIVLKGKLKGSVGEVWIRKGLVIFQFSISIILIVSVFVVYRQIQFVQNKHLGYDKENMIVFESNGKISESFDAFIDEMKKIPGIENASGLTNGMFMAPGGDLEWSGTESSSNFSRFIVYYDFIETLGLTFLEGQSFSPEYTGEAKIMINESAAKLMQLKEPVGTNVKFWGNDAKIIGVVKDFHFQSLHEDVGPLFFHLTPLKYLASIIVRLKPGDQQYTLARLEEFYSEFNPGYKLNYRFVEGDYQYLYQSENKVGELSKYFAGIAILISCLGLFGLSAFTAERRIKEIGIRKILGSSVFQIVRMLSEDFTKMVLMAILIALPISYMITKDWLQGFAYSIPLRWWFFASASIVSLIISWVTVGYQTLKAAHANPSDSLKYE